MYTKSEISFFPWEYLRKEILKYSVLCVHLNWLSKHRYLSLYHFVHFRKTQMTTSTRFHLTKTIYLSSASSARVLSWARSLRNAVTTFVRNALCSTTRKVSDATLAVRKPTVSSIRPKKLSPGWRSKSRRTQLATTMTMTNKNISKCHLFVQF